MKAFPLGWMVLFAMLLLFSGQTQAGSIVVVDNAGDNSITKYDYTTGAYLGVFTIYPMARPLGMTADSNGNVYIADITSNTIEKFNVNGTHLATFTSPNLSDNEGMVVSNGFLYSASYNTGTITKFSLTGTDLGVFATIDSSGLQGVVADPVGNLYVSDYNGASHGHTIQKVASDGTVSQFANMGGEPPIGLAIDSSGNIYASDPIYGLVVHKFSSSGVDLGDIITGTAAYYVTTDTKDVLFAPLIWSNAIEMYSGIGTDLGAFTTTGLNTPVALAIVPEPSTPFLLVAGAALLGFKRRQPGAKKS